MLRNKILCSALLIALVLTTFTACDGTAEASEEAYEEGHTIGYGIGSDEGYSDGYNDGYEEGYEEGYSAGRSEYPPIYEVAWELLGIGEYEAVEAICEIWREDYVLGDDEYTLSELKTGLQNGTMYFDEHGYFIDTNKE